MHLYVGESAEQLLHQVPEQEHDGEDKRSDGIAEEAVLPPQENRQAHQPENHSHRE